MELVGDISINKKLGLSCPGVCLCKFSTQAGWTVQLSARSRTNRGNIFTVAAFLYVIVCNL